MEFHSVCTNFVPLFKREHSGCSTVGSILGLGPRGRTFESCHPDEKEATEIFSVASFRFITIIGDIRMADNYLEKKMEEYRAQAPAASRTKTLTLNQLLVRNRSHRGYDARRTVSAEELRRIVNVNTRIPSARNRQCLRFRLVTADEAHKVQPLIRLGGALPELHLPLEGTEPQAFIVVCSTVEEDRWMWVDLGISAQSMLLKATEMGLNGICIGAFNAEALTEALALPSTPVLVIAIGKGIEDIRLTEIAEEESHVYYRTDGIHYVPKVKLDDLIIS